MDTMSDFTLVNVLTKHNLGGVKGGNLSLITKTLNQAQSFIGYRTFDLGAHDLRKAVKRKVFDELVSKHHSSVHNARHTWKRLELVFEGRHLFLAGYVNLKFEAIG